MSATITAPKARIKYKSFVFDTYLKWEGNCAGMAYAEHKKLAIHSYHSHAEGLLEFVDGSYRFTEIVVRPIIVLQAELAAAAGEAVALAHRDCLVANYQG